MRFKLGITVIKLPPMFCWSNELWVILNIFPQEGLPWIQTFNYFEMYFKKMSKYEIVPAKIWSINSDIRLHTFVVFQLIIWRLSSFISLNRSRDDIFEFKRLQNRSDTVCLNSSDFNGSLSKWLIQSLSSEITNCIINKIKFF